MPSLANLHVIGHTFRGVRHRITREHYRTECGQSAKLLELGPIQTCRQCFPTFAVPWGEIEGYLGFFRPHNYLKQSSPPFFGRLFEGGFLLALEALIPSDITIGAGSLVTLNDEMALYPEVELLVAPSRWQNPQQIVPAASITFLYGGLGARPAIHEGR
ncbi:MAG: hypothetical protein ACOC8L_02025 [Spirochaetota bacterium]